MVSGYIFGTRTFSIVSKCVFCDLLIISECISATFSIVSGCVVATLSMDLQYLFDTFFGGLEVRLRYLFLVRGSFLYTFSARVLWFRDAFSEHAQRFRNICSARFRRFEVCFRYLFM